jgi:hypothetical protein
MWTAWWPPVDFVFDVRRGERDQQQRHADPVVETALDVQSLADA